MERIEKAGAGGFEHGEQLFFALGERLYHGPLLCEEGQLVGKKEGHAAIALAQRLHACPCDFACGNEGVEAGGRVIRNARGEDGRFQQRCGQRGSLQVLDGVEQGVKMRMSTAARSEQPLPVGEEAGERALLHGFHFAAQTGQRFASNLAENFRIAPFAVETAGAEAAFQHAPFLGEPVERGFDHRGIKCEAVRSFLQRKGAVCACEAAHEFEDRMRYRLQQRGGQAGRQGNAQPIAVARGVFGG